MRKRVRRAGLRASIGCIGATLLSHPVAAQTTDPLFRAWEWAEEPHSARSAALGGAVAASGWGASTAVIQPGALSQMSEADARLSLRHAGAGRLGVETAEARWTLAEVVFAQPLGLRYGWGAYHYTRRAIDLRTEESPLPGGVRDRGELGVEARETGVAFGVTLTPTLRLGARVGVSQLDLDGRSSTIADAGSRETRSRVRDSRPRLGLGLLFAPSQRLQFGAVYDSQTRWSGTARTDEETIAYGLTAPTRWGAGLAYRPSSAVRFLAQLDWVRWSEVKEGLGASARRPSPDEFRFVDTIDARFGLELRLHYGEAGVWNRAAVRFGFAFRSRGLLDYIGPDETEKARFPGAVQATDLTIGATFGLAEVAFVWREPRGMWVFGLRQSF